MYIILKELGVHLFFFSLLTLSIGTLIFSISYFFIKNKKLYSFFPFLLAIVIFLFLPEFQTISERWEGLYYSRMIRIHGPNVLKKYRYGPIYPTLFFLTESFFGFNIELISFLHILFFSLSLTLIFLILKKIYPNNTLTNLLTLLSFTLIPSTLYLSEIIKGIFQLNFLFFTLALYFLVRTLQSKNLFKFKKCLVYLTLSILLFIQTKVENLAIVYPLFFSLVLFKFNFLKKAWKEVTILLILFLTTSLPIISKYLEHKERAMCQNVHRPEIQAAFEKKEFIETLTSREFSFLFLKENFKKMLTYEPISNILVPLIFVCLCISIILKKPELISINLISVIFLFIYLFNCAYVVREEYTLYQFPEAFIAPFISLPALIDFIFRISKLKNFQNLKVVILIFIVFTLLFYSKNKIQIIKDPCQDIGAIKKVIKFLEDNNLKAPLVVMRHYEKFIWATIYNKVEVFSLEQELEKINRINKFIIISKDDLVHIPIPRNLTKIGIVESFKIYISTT